MSGVAMIARSSSPNSSLGSNLNLNSIPNPNTGRVSVVDVVQIMNLNRSVGGELSELTPREELLKILECPICQEIPKPPIYNCSKGHTVCNKCRKKLTKCALCKAVLTDSRNFALESIVSTSKFMCDFVENGCPEILQGTNVHKHLEECEFRPLSCHLGRMDNCNNSLVEFSTYLQHLRQVHHIIKGKEDNLDTFTLRQTFTESTKNKHNWLCTYKEFDGQVFLTRAFKFGSMFYWSLAIIGGEKEANKYVVKVTIEKSRLEPAPKYELTIPVLSIRRTKAEIMELPHANLTETMLKYFCQVVMTPDKKEKYQWKTQYKIIKI